MGSFFHSLVMIWLGFLLSSNYFTIKFPQSTKLYQNINPYIGHIGFGAIVFSIALGLDVIIDFGFVVKHQGTFFFNWLLGFITFISVFISGVILGTETLAALLQNKRQSKVILWLFSLQKNTRQYRDKFGLMIIIFAIFLIARQVYYRSMFS